MTHITFTMKSRRTLFALAATIGFALAPHLVAAAGFNYTMPLNSFDRSGINSWFDHTSPGYGAGDIYDNSTTMTRSTGVQYVGQSATSVGSPNCSNFNGGAGCYNGHNGIDFGTYSTTGHRVLAAASGVVRKAGWNNASNHSAGYGIMIRLCHDQYGQSTIYGHLSSTSV